jgi:hypothetical protein
MAIGNRRGKLQKKRLIGTYKLSGSKDQLQLTISTDLRPTEFPAEMSQPVEVELEEYEDDTEPKLIVTPCEDD